LIRGGKLRVKVNDQRPETTMRQRAAQFHSFDQMKMLSY
jgi:hypothetical protein